MAPVAEIVVPAQARQNPPNSAITTGASFPLVATEPPLIVVMPPVSVTTPSALAPLVDIVELVSDSAPPEEKLPKGPLKAPRARSPVAASMPPFVVTLIPFAVIDERAPLTASPDAPLPLVVIVEPVSCTTPPACASTPTPIVPVVAIVVGPTPLTPIVVVPPFKAYTPTACAPAVLIDPPEIVVVPPVEVMTPDICAPCVEIDVSVSFATPPVVKLPNGPL